MRRGRVLWLAGGTLLCLVVVAAVYISSLGRSWRYSRISHIMMTVMEGYSQQNELSITARGNALAAAQVIRRGRYQPSTPPFLIGARMFAYRGENRLCVDRLPVDRKENSLVFLFSLPGGVVGQILTELEPVSDPLLVSESVFSPVEVSGETLASLGKMNEDGTYHISSADCRDLLPGGPLVVPVPEGDVAVGIIYEDGSYSNFVALERL